jgi:hypothetical protein
MMISLSLELLLSLKINSLNPEQNQLAGKCQAGRRVSPPFLILQLFLAHLAERSFIF